MSLNLTPCGHLQGIRCLKCAPQKQTALGDKEAAELILATLKPKMQEWFSTGQMTAAQASISLLGMAIGLAIELGVSRNQLVEAIDKVYNHDGAST